MVRGKMLNLARGWLSRTRPAVSIEAPRVRAITTSTGFAVVERREEAVSNTGVWSWNAARQAGIPNSRMLHRSPDVSDRRGVELAKAENSDRESTKGGDGKSPKFYTQQNIREETIFGLRDQFRQEQPIFAMQEAVAKATDQSGKDKDRLPLHGALRVANFEEARQVVEVVEALGLRPVNAYKLYPQLPIVGVGLCSPDDSFRIFLSTLQLDMVGVSTKEREQVTALISKRKIFPEELLTLAKKAKEEGGLVEEDMNLLKELFIHSVTLAKEEPVQLETYNMLLGKGPQGVVLADIACFIRSHLNHLTPSTDHIEEAHAIMNQIFEIANTGAYKKALAYFKEQVGEVLFKQADVSDEVLKDMVTQRRRVEAQAAIQRGESAEWGELPGLQMIEVQGPPIIKIKHNGEERSLRLLLNQTSFKAVPVEVPAINKKGERTTILHMAPFGEIEANGVALTPMGMKLVEGKKTAKEIEAVLPKSFEEAVLNNIAYATFTLTEKVKEYEGGMKWALPSTLRQLVKDGIVKVSEQPYVHFLGASAANIFEGNLPAGQTTELTEGADADPWDLLHRGEVIAQDAHIIFRQRQAESLRAIVNALGITIDGMRPESTVTEVAHSQCSSDVRISRLVVDSSVAIKI